MLVHLVLVLVLLIAGLITRLAPILKGYLTKRGAKSSTTSQETIDGRVGNYLADVPEMWQVGNQFLEVLYKKPVTGKNGRASSLCLRVPAAAPTTLQFNRETGFDRFCKGLGIAREHQTGDVDFDDMVYIRGPSFGYAEQFLENSDKRGAILNLMAQGFADVRLTQTHMEALWPRFNPLTDDFPELIEEAGLGLFTLADQVPAVDPDLASARTDWSKIWSRILWLTALLWAATFVFVFWFEPIRTWDLALFGLFFFGIAYPVFVAMAGILLHGSSTSHDLWAPLARFCFILLGFGSFGAVAAMNGLSDNSQPTERRIMVFDKHISAGRKSSKTYYATVADWARPGETIDFKVSYHDYLAIMPKRSHLFVTTSAGRLGIEWLKTLRVQ